MFRNRYFRKISITNRLTFAGFLAVRCFSKPVTCTAVMDWPKIFLFGDSLTQYSNSKDGCWGALLANHLQRKCDVINRGFSGYNTRWCKLILPKLITASNAKDIRMVTVFLGANDSVDSKLCQKQHVPLDEFRQNMMEIIEYLQGIGIQRQKIVIISPPSCAEKKWEKDCKVNDRVFGKFNEPTKAYAKCCMEVAKETGTESVDLYTAMMNEMNWEEMLNDGLHLSELGSQFLFTLMTPVLDKLTADLPLQMPYWGDIDNNNPHVALDPYISQK